MASVIGTISSIAAVAGTAFTAVQGYQSAKSQQEAAEYNAKIAAANAKMTSEQGVRAEELQREQARAVQSRARAAAIESGTYSGTMMDVMGQSALGAELDALNTRYSYMVRARDYSSQSALDTYQASAYGKSATSKLVGGAINTIASTSKLNQKNRYDY